jgi:hypothetical protein
MNESGVFLFGLFVFLIVGGGVGMTIYEMKKMGNRDQDDSYPRSIPVRQGK